MSRDIGGFFGLELSRGKELHKNALRLNSGRNAFRYILQAYDVKKIYMPRFICESMIDVVKEFNIQIHFYEITDNFTPIIDFEWGEGEYLLIVNYLGICDKIIEELVKKYENLIVDNCQSFFSYMISRPTFYSCRKFFGVADGAYLYTNKYVEDALIQYASHPAHLLNNKYEDYRMNEFKLSQQRLAIMSSLTQRLMDSINYDYIIKKRNENFEFLNMKLKDINKFSFNNFSVSINSVPMFYPLLIDNGKELSDKLEKIKIYRTNFWNHPRLVLLPIDQRYDLDDMGYVVRMVRRLL